MNGLTKIKDDEGKIYDVTYDCDNKIFLVEGVEFKISELKKYKETGEIEIIQDDNGLLKKFLV